MYHVLRTSCRFFSPRGLSLAARAWWVSRDQGEKRRRGVFLDSDFRFPIYDSDVFFCHPWITQLPWAGYLGMGTCT